VIPAFSVVCGDALTALSGMKASSVQCCVTSPPYWGLRDYGVEGQLGLERTPEEYVAKMVEVFREVRRVLADDGTLWLNLGDSYAVGGTGAAPSTKSTLSRHGPDGRSPYLDALSAGKPRKASDLKPKDLVGIPWRVAFALQADGWWLRSDIIWSKPNPMPESVTDRPTKAHEYIFLLSKASTYYYDADAIREPHVRVWDEGNGGNLKVGGQRAVGLTALHKHGGDYPLPNPLGRNRRSVWHVTTTPFPDAHFATFPPKLIEPCILAGCPVGGTVLDPFTGSGTTGSVANALNRNFVGIELNPTYAAMARKRIGDTQTPMLLEGA
jgi:DNA modification methylase